MNLVGFVMKNYSRLHRELPASQYEDAMTWLGEWLQSLTGETPF